MTILHIARRADWDESLHAGAYRVSTRGANLDQVGFIHASFPEQVAEAGRGTQTRFDEPGEPVHKPVMSTKDLRFFDDPAAPVLPDGHRRRGISVVAALSTWLVHENRRAEGSWTRRYEHGVPVGDLEVIPAATASGTTVHFMPGDEVVPARADAAALRLIARFPHLAVTVEEQR